MVEQGEDKHLDKGVFYFPQMAQIRKIDQLTDSEILLWLRLEKGTPLSHSPGQFVQVTVLGIGEAPISICSSPSRTEGFELCVRAVGNLSMAVHRLSVGSWVGIRGPYGKGFPVDIMRGQNVIVVAGGIGLAPSRSLVNYILDHRDAFGRLVVVCGAKTPASLLFRDELKTWAAHPDLEIHVTVDEPDESWSGRTGVVTEPLREISIDPGQTLAAVTGPPVFYRFVAAELLEKRLPEDRIYFS